MKTDNEIIKSLECCKEPEFLCNSNCPLFKDDNCRMTLPKNSLDLIKRLQAENEEKDIEIDILIRKKDTAYDEVCELRAEIERLNTIIRDNFLDTNKQILEAQDEAIKEFADRLKKEYIQGFWEEHRYIDIEDIDDLLKEME